MEQISDFKLIPKLSAIYHDQMDIIEHFLMKPLASPMDPPPST